ncbi:MAG: methyltransferase domain-containing protein [Deltaproteobacteria bacterium]|nr:methyltransferase domain-containing protein [Deltaproteobacteria bacterium]
MKRRLLELLICPACLPEEKPLRGSIAGADGDDIVTGRLTCPGCGAEYPVEDGVGVLLPPASSRANATRRRYETEAVVSSYLWSHFGDLFGDPEAGRAYAAWSGLVPGGHGLGLDAGCAVGRFAFEVSPRCDFVVGLDTSATFVRLARKLMIEGSVTFPLIMEGRLTEPRTIVRAEGWRPENAEFIVGDALALPFPHDAFSMLASLNLIDKLPKPLRHLQEMNRVAKGKGAFFLFSDPFSWSEESAGVEDWLGGKGGGRFGGEGIRNVRRLLEGEEGITGPPWQIRDEGRVSWMIRNHRNHYEMIRSEFLVSTR